MTRLEIDFAIRVISLLVGFVSAGGGGEDTRPYLATSLLLTTHDLFHKGGKGRPQLFRLKNFLYDSVESKVPPPHVHLLRHAISLNVPSRTLLEHMHHVVSVCATFVPRSYDSISHLIQVLGKGPVNTWIM